MIAYGSCVSSWEKFGRNIVPRAENRPLLGLAGQSSIAQGYNAILEAFMNNIEIDALVLLHDDLEITDTAAEEKILAALAEPDVAIMGVIGAGTPQTLAWWNGGIIGHQRTDSMAIIGPVLAGDVACTDGSLMAFSPWAIQNLRFDMAYQNFHGYDVDVGMAAHQMGKRVVVADIDTHHHTTVGFKSSEIEQHWLAADEVFRLKWWMA